MIPCETLTCCNAARSSWVITPGLRAGSLSPRARASRTGPGTRASSSAERRELVSRDPIAKLGLVPEREERLVAAGGRTRARDGEHLLPGEVRLAAHGRTRECAVVADVPAELGQRDEDLGRIRTVRVVRSARAAAQTPSTGVSTRARASASACSWSLLRRGSCGRASRASRPESPSGRRPRAARCRAEEPLEGISARNGGRRSRWIRRRRRRSARRRGA